MEQPDNIERLNALVQLDIDATLAYSKALEHIDVAEVYDVINGFKVDHERHIDELSALVRVLGGIPPDRKRDMRGFFLENFTTLRSQTGTVGALKAMRLNEEFTNRSYENTAETDLPPEALELVRRNLEDERRHLAYIKYAVEERPWDRSHARHAV